MDQVQQLNSDPRTKKLEKKLGSYYWLRNLCRGIMSFGFTASAAGNVLHARKDFIGISIALAAPVFFFLAFEMLSRVPGNKTRRVRMALRLLGAGTIAGITGLLSYFHQRDAIFQQTGDRLQAMLLPIAVDSLMIIGSISLMELGDLVEDLEAHIEAVKDGARVTAKVMAPKPRVEQPISKRMIVARAWKDFPHLSIKELAEKTGVSYNYVADTVSKLKQQAQQAAVEVV